MTIRIKTLLVTAFLISTARFAGAEVVHHIYQYDMSNTTAQTLGGLGTKFLIGCIVLGLAIVAASAISKRK